MVPIMQPPPIEHAQTPEERLVEYYLRTTQVQPLITPPSTTTTRHNNTFEGEQSTTSEGGIPIILPTLQ